MADADRSLHEATNRTCVFQEFNWSEREVSDVCGRPAHHLLTLAIEGVPDLHQEILCCKHKAQTLDELMASDHNGVTVVGDQVLAATISARVFQRPEGWVYQVTHTDPAGTVTMFPAVMLEATTQEEAMAEANGRVQFLEWLGRDD
jgi:hypothetical protein